MIRLWTVFEKYILMQHAITGSVLIVVIAICNNVFSNDEGRRLETVHLCLELTTSTSAAALLTPNVVFSSIQTRTV